MADSTQKIGCATDSLALVIVILARERIVSCAHNDLAVIADMVEDRVIYRHTLGHFYNKLVGSGLSFASRAHHGQGFVVMGEPEGVIIGHIGKSSLEVDGTAHSGAYIAIHFIVQDRKTLPRISFGLII